MTDLPDGWRRVRLGDVADTALGKMLDAARPKGSCRVPYLRNVNVQWGRIDTDDVRDVALNADEQERFRLQDGDLLVCEGGDIGRAAVWRGGSEYMAYQKALHRVRSKGDLDLTYLRYLLEHYATTGDLRSRATGSTILHLPQQKLREVPIPLPHLAEQRRIVGSLDDHFSQLDAAKSYLEVSSAALPSLRLAVTARFRRRFVGNGFPLRRIGDFCDTALGKMLDSKKASGILTPYLRNINVRWGQVDAVDVLQVALNEQERLKFALEADDLLVCEGGEPGRCAVWSGSSTLMAFQKALHRVRIRDSSARPQFVAAMLEETVRSGRAERLFTGTTIKHLPQEKLRALEIPLPPLDVQDHALRHLADLQIASNRLRGDIEAGLAHGSALRTSLLYAAFSGRLCNVGGAVPEAEDLANV